LQGLSETHFVGQDTGNTILVEGDKPVQTSDLVITKFTVNESRRFAEDGCGVSAVLFVLKKLRVLFLFGSAASLATRTPRALRSLSILFFLLRILSVNFRHDVFDFGVGVCLDEVTEQVSKAEQVSESANRVILLQLSVRKRVAEYNKGRAYLCAIQAAMLFAQNTFP
jgi:hypothetical protein